MVKVYLRKGVLLGLVVKNEGQNVFVEVDGTTYKVHVDQVETFETEVEIKNYTKKVRKGMLIETESKGYLVQHNGNDFRVEKMSKTDNGWYGDRYFDVKGNHELKGGSGLPKIVKTFIKFLIKSVDKR